jgi:capsular exopolysaccharide synthesis family protein
MEFSLNWKTLRADRSAVFVEKQLENIREELSQSEREIQGFLEKEGAVLLPEQAKELIRVSAELELEKRKVEIQEGVLNTVTNGLAHRNHRKNPIALTSDFLVGDEVLVQSIGALNELVMKRETLLADVTEEHPQVIRMNEEIRRVRSKIEDSVRASLGRIKDRRESIDQGLESIQEELKKFPGKERQLADLRRHLEVGQDMYKYLMTKLEEFRIMKASTTTDKRIIDRAVMPIASVRPNRKMLMILAMVTGLLLGVAVVFARRTLDSRVQDEEEAKQLSRLPLYGAIPDLRMMKIIHRGESVIDSVWRAPKGPAAESFRMIRTNIEFTSVDAKIPKVILATSSEASEGKSTIIANLAVALSKAGNKVLLVDLDLRRPNQYQLFALPRAPGISDHLVGRAKLSIHHLAGYDLDVATSGNEPPESQRLLASKALSDLIEKWCGEYVHVLLDTPPLLVADSLILSRLCDMMLFVVRPGQCRGSNLNLARSTYEKTEVIKGLVINGVGARRGGGYYHYYRGSYYGSKTSDTQET